MRCNYIRAVGATLLTYVSVLPELKSIARRERIYPFRMLHLLPLSISDMQQRFRHCLPLAELEGKMPLAADEV